MFILARKRSIPLLLSSESEGKDIGVIEISSPLGEGRIIIEHARGSPALGSATAVHAAVTDTGSPIVISTLITNPDVPRAIVATPGGTTANVTAVQTIVTGTDENDAPLTETLPAFSAGAATAVTSINAFKTVSSITQPANGASVTVSYGTGPKIGLGRALASNTVIAAYLNNVKEGTAPTVTVNAVMSKNLVSLNSALNGTPVRVDYYDS